MTDILSPTLPKTGKRGFFSSQEFYSSNPIDKKCKHYDNSNELNSSISFNGSVHSAQQFKRSKFEYESSNDIQLTSFQKENQGNANNLLDQQYLEFQHYDAINKSLQESNLKKSNEITQLLNKLANMENLNKTLTEDNKILKRAVSIQDSKIREVSSQNEQLNQYLNQASEIVQNLERANNNLRENIYRSVGNSYGSGFMPPQPPPDVF